MSDVMGETTKHDGPEPPEDPQLSTSSRGQRKALLIGIDDYPDDNLNGCVQDVLNVEAMLQNVFEFDAVNKLLAPVPRPPKTHESSAAAPTRTEIIKNIRGLRDQSKPNDFVYIHYSGHGCRLPTMYKDLKKAKEDEALCCFDDTFLRDIELAVLLKELTDKDISVLAVLDCCHSGGALRKQNPTQWRNRSMSTPLNPREETWLGFDSTGNFDGRTIADNDQHWYYGERRYHVIAACQPHEYALELPAVKNREPQGLLTSLLVEGISNLRDLASLTSYEMLMGDIRARCQELSEQAQSPFIFGDETRALFSLQGTSAQADNLRYNTFVREIRNQRVILDCGSSGRVAEHDEYEILRPDGTDPGIRVHVQQVRNFTSEASVTEGSIEEVQPGFRARLSSRSHVTNIILQHSDTQPMERLREQCRAFFNPQNPLSFHVAPSDVDASFYVRIRDDSMFEILGRDQTVLPNIPLLGADGESVTARSLCSVLEHLSTYFSVERLHCARPLHPAHEFQLNVSYEGLEEDEVAACEINYRNATPKTVWITVLNLAPDWSIVPLIYQPGTGIPVEGRESIESFVTGVVLPGIVRQQNPRSIVERVKMFVSTAAHDFSMFRLGPLGDAQRRGYRTMRPRVAAPNWDVYSQEYEINLH